MNIDWKSVGGLAVLALTYIASSWLFGGAEGGVLFAAVATYAITTSKTDVNGVWRKVQAPLQTAAQFMVDEWDMLDNLQDFEIDWSARSIDLPVDITDDVGIASIPEGGYEARPASPNPVDGSLTWILYNGRFTVSKTARWIDQKNRKAMLERQILYQGRKKLQALARRVGFDFYGFSTAVAAKVVSVAADVFTIKDQYGVAGLGSTTTPYRVDDVFRVNDYVAILNPTGPALRGIQKVTAVTTATPSITLDGTPTGSAANDLIVFANSVGNTVLADTDHGNGLVGMLDIGTSTSVHGISKSTNPKWDVGYSDTAGGRFTGIKLRKAKQGIQNNGGGTLNTVLWDQGVENDVVAQLQAGLRFSNAFAMEMDGAPKAQGVKLTSTRFVPEGYVFAFDKKSLKKLALIPKPGTPAWEDGDKLQDQSGYVFPLDYPCALVTTNRANHSYFSALTRQ